MSAAFAFPVPILLGVAIGMSFAVVAARALIAVVLSALALAALVRDARLLRRRAPVVSVLILRGISLNADDPLFMPIAVNRS